MRIQILLKTILDILLGGRQTDILLAKVSYEELAQKLLPVFHTNCNAVTTFSYRDKTVRALIHALKYESRYEVAEILAPFLVDTLLEHIGDNAMLGSVPTLLIPIPLSQRRLEERGHNQAQTLANKLAEKLHASHNTLLLVNSNTLIRTRDTPSQTTLSKARRETNLANAFSVSNSSLIQNSSIILIDDVLTTGSTLREARNTLLTAGATDVYAIAVAH
jgi:competence protein ComFC